MISTIASLLLLGAQTHQIRSSVALAAPSGFAWTLPGKAPSGYKTVVSGPAGFFGTGRASPYSGQVARFRKGNVWQLFEFRDQQPPASFDEFAVLSTADIRSYKWERYDVKNKLPANAIPIVSWETNPRVVNTAQGLQTRYSTKNVFFGRAVKQRGSSDPAKWETICVYMVDGDVWSVKGGGPPDGEQRFFSLNFTNALGPFDFIEVLVKS